MSERPGFELGVSIGTGCNFRCRHCILGNVRAPRRILKPEISLVSSEINKYRPHAVVFTGGEPFLYSREMRAVVSGVTAPGRIEWRVVTNGYFANSLQSATGRLKSLPFIGAVQLSYDEFHGEFLQGENIQNLKEACSKIGVDFSVVSVIRSPLDMLFLNGQGALAGVDVSFQRALPLGKAAAAGLAYNYGVFDTAVLERKCPNNGKVIYNCGEGFTTCCAFLATGRNKKLSVHSTIAEHRASKFYSLISRFCFGELAEMAGVPLEKMTAADSAPCILCMKVVPRILERSCKGKFR